jgi:DNA primase
MVVVEGYTDVLALHQAGIRETVAIMGTAITPPQIAEMARVAPDVILALDADRAGQEAMLRAVRVAEASGVQLRAVMMPEGRDPADLLETEGADAVQARLADALAMIQFQVRRLLADANLDTPAGRDRALDEARTVIAAAPQRSAMRDELVRDVANALDVPEEYVTAAAAGAASRAPTHAAAARPGNGSAPALPAGGSAGELAFRAEREFLARCLASGELGRDLLGRVSDDQLSTDPMRKARRHLLEHFDDPLVGLSEDDPAHAALVMQVTHAAQEMPRSTEAVLRMSILQLEKRSIEREIRRAGQEGDHARQLELAQAEQRVRADMDEVMGQTE